MRQFPSFFLTLIWASGAFAQSPRLSHEFANAKGAVDVIVKYKSAPADDPSDPHHQKIIGRGGVYKSTQHIIRSASYRLNAEQLADLANDPEVEYVSPDHPLSALSSTSVLGSGEGTPASSGGSAPSSIITMGINSSSSSSSSFSPAISPIAIDYFREAAYSNDAISAGWTGDGVGVALIDSGITPNQDLGNVISYSQSFVPGDRGTADAFILKARKPSPSSNGVIRGSPAISPHDCDYEVEEFRIGNGDVPTRATHTQLVSRGLERQ